MALTSRHPEDKLGDQSIWISTLLGKRKVLLRELQVVVGHLNFACKVVAPECALLRRLCDAIKGANHQFPFVQIGEGDAAG